MKTTTPTLIFLSALISTVVSSPVTSLQARYTHIQLTQRASTNSTSPSTTSVGNTIIIQEGDTLSSIAAATGVGICDIAKANAIADPNLILAGAMLTIPASTGTKDDTSCLKTA